MLCHTMLMRVLLLAMTCLITDCTYQSSTVDISQALQLAQTPATLSDDLNIEQLVHGIRSNIKQLKKNGTQGDFNFGGDIVSKQIYVKGLEFLIREYEKKPSKEQFIQTVRRNFDFYRIYGGSGKGDMRLTAYVEADIPGSKTRSKQYPIALYAKPTDLVEIPLKAYTHPDYSHLAIDSNLKMLGRIDGSQIVPFYSREEIDGGNKLAGRGLELCYVKAFDAFFMHIQGSGTIHFQDGTTVRLGYAGQNGRKYIDYHDAWFGKVPLIKLNLRDVGSYLDQLPHREAMTLLYLNPSYVFFRKLRSGPITSMGSEVISGRTIATDPRYFPKGALAYIVFNKTNGDTVNRFVLDQDAGGAIKGPGRVDLFVGTGTQNLELREATGSMYYLLPNYSLRQKLGSFMDRALKATR